MGFQMIENVVKSIDQTIRDNTGEHVNDELLKRLAQAAMVAALPHIKEAMEYHGVEGAMNKMIIKRLEEQCK